MVVWREHQLRYNNYSLPLLINIIIIIYYLIIIIWYSYYTVHSLKSMELVLKNENFLLLLYICRVYADHLDIMKLGMKKGWKTINNDLKLKIIWDRLIFLILSTSSILFYFISRITPERFLVILKTIIPLDWSYIFIYIM